MRRSEQCNFEARHFSLFSLFSLFPQQINSHRQLVVGGNAGPPTVRRSK
jgi:hypothetical protein